MNDRREYRISNIEQGISKLNFLVRYFERNFPFRICLLFASLNIFLFSSCSAKSIPTKDTSAYTLVHEIESDARFIATDKLQQLYIVTEKNEVIKYNAEGKQLFYYSNNTLGNLGFIEATNPFSVLLFYQDFSIVYTLDRTLNKTGEFNLFDLGLTGVQAVGMSNDNNVWIYDNPFFRIKKINRNGEVLRESDNIRNQLEINLQPNFILERENWLYVNDPDLGVLVFDIYGQYSKTIDIKGLTHFQVIDNQLIYQEKNELKSFHLQSLTTQIIELPDGIEEDDQILIQKNKLFVRKDSKVEIYSF